MSIPRQGVEIQEAVSKEKEYLVIPNFGLSFVRELMIFKIKIYHDSHDSCY